MDSRLERATYHPLLTATFVMLTHLEHTVTTLITPRVFNEHSVDYVSTDMAALASHMDCCAIKRSRFFGVHAALEMAKSLVFSRLVTAAFLVAVVLAAVGIV